MVKLWATANPLHHQVINANHIFANFAALRETKPFSRQTLILLPPGQKSANPPTKQVSLNCLELCFKQSKFQSTKKLTFCLKIFSTVQWKPSEKLIQFRLARNESR